MNTNEKNVVININSADKDNQIDQTSKGGTEAESLLPQCEKDTHLQSAENSCEWQDLCESEDTSTGANDERTSNELLCGNSIQQDENFERVWEFTGYQNRVNPSTGKVLFSIMSYNILSQRLLEKRVDLHGYDPRSVLWEYRGPQLGKEIYDINADILCLQELEVDCNDMFKYLQSIGYIGIMKPRNPLDADGVAIYYKPSMFKLVEYVSADYVDPFAGIVNCGLIVKLSLVGCREEERHLVVANAHLPPGNETSPMKVLQVELLLSEVERFGGGCPVVLAGDLQVEPFSPLYRLVTMGQLPHQQARKRRRPAPSCQPLATPIPGIKQPALLTPNPDKWQVVHLMRPVRSQRHELVFRSAYRHGRCGSEHAECSRLRDGVPTSPDYILYGGKPARDLGTLELVARYRLPTRNQAKALGPLPSDHLPLVANFAIEL